MAGHSPEPERTAIRWGAVFTDMHFWIPVAVLLAGLAVLHWIR